MTATCAHRSPLAVRIDGRVLLVRVCKCHYWEPVEAPRLRVVAS